MQPVLDMLNQGGWVLVEIALVSVVAWSLILSAYWRLSERTGSGWKWIQQAVEQLSQGRPLPESIPSEASGNFIGQLLQSDITRTATNRWAFEAQVMPLLNSETVSFVRTLRVVAVLAAVMPLLGLLGTVLGMITTFGALTNRDLAQVDALAGGISQALITTQAGLVISVPVLLVHGYLNAKIRRYLDTASVLVKKIETAVCVDS